MCVLNGWRYRLNLVVGGPTTRPIKDKCSAKSYVLRIFACAFAKLTHPLIRKD
jgi:hypothetical protein